MSVVAFPCVAVNDNAPPALWICPLCENGAFLLEASANDGVIIKCASCFADCTQAVASHLPMEVDLCQP